MTKKICVSDIILCCILFFLPFIHVNIGLSVADQGYNLANFEAFPDMNQTWMVATLVANIVGKIFTFLPFGHSMLGMNVYCTLLLSAVSIAIFLILKKDYNKYAVFTGLIIAISFSWAPKVTLYQYLSYYLFCVATMVLVKGLQKGKRKMLYIAGVILGINLFVRFPNVLQCALILVVIAAAFLYKKKMKDALKDIGICIAGYATVALPVIVSLELIYGSGTYAGMVKSLFAMTESATSYTPFAMFYAMYSSYITNFKWFGWFLVEAVAATVLYGFLKKKWMKYSAYAVMALVFLVILRVYWYWGILNIQYTTYNSVYIWGVCFLLLGILTLLFALFNKKTVKEKKLYALGGLIIILITPLGSNNALYSNYNNLYLVAPIVIGSLADLLLRFLRKEDGSKKIWHLSPAPAVAVSFMLIGIVFVQTFLFHIFFVFGDAGIDGNKKVMVEGNHRLAGILTTQDNAEEFTGLTAFLYDERMQGRECIVWSHSPVIYYAMELDCAIGHMWPMLDSYPYEEFAADIETMDEYPVIIYEALYYPDLLVTNEEADQKTQVICELMQSGNYKEVYRNRYYVVCIPEKQSK